MPITVGQDSAKARKTLSAGNQSFAYYSIPAAEAKPAKAEGASDAARQDALRQVLAELEDIKKLL